MRSKLLAVVAAVLGTLTLVAVLPASAAAPKWREVKLSSAPPPRFDAAVAYHVAQRKVVIFGGNGADGMFGDSWTFNGSRWSRLSVPPRLERGSASMVYDAARRKVVLFGGYGANGRPWGDTWTFDGSRWSRVKVLGPSKRYGAMMVYDAARRKVVLFGGRSGGSTVDDTWTFDGSRWKQVSGQGPSPRHKASMVYDAARRKVVLFGGEGCDTVSGQFRPPPRCGDTWTFDGTRWKRVGGSGPSPRANASMVYDAARRNVVLFGGECDVHGVGNNDIGPDIYFDPNNTPACDETTWTFNGSRWTQVSGAGPAPRSQAAMVYDSARKASLMVGGFAPDTGIGGTGYGTTAPAPFGDTWLFNGSRWTRVSGTGPSARSGAALAYDSARRQVVLFGGTGQIGTNGGVGGTGVNETPTWGWFDDTWKL